MFKRNLARKFLLNYIILRLEKSNKYRSADENVVLQNI